MIYNLGRVVGNGISSIEKTSTTDNIDTYTITLDNGDTFDFTVTNAASVENVLTQSDIVDNLTSNDNTKVLSAKQGKILADTISGIEEDMLQ